MGMFGMFFGLLLFAGLVVGVIFLIVWAVRQTTSSGRSVTPVSPASRPTARQILDDRYARGEITREEYLTALSDLGESTQ